jgi:hypothetical protein
MNPSPFVVTSPLWSFKISNCLWYTHSIQPSHFVPMFFQEVIGTFHSSQGFCCCDCYMFGIDFWGLQSAPKLAIYSSSNEKKNPPHQHPNFPVSTLLRECVDCGLTTSKPHKFITFFIFQIRYFYFSHAFHAIEKSRRWMSNTPHGTLADSWCWSFFFFDK